MDKSKIATALLIACIAILLLLHVFFSSWITAATTYISIAFMFVSVLTGIYAFRIHGVDSVQGKIILALTGFAVFDFLGFLTWEAYDFFELGKPIVSAGDTFWILGYVLAVWGISMIPEISKKQFSGVGKAAVGIGWAVLACMLIYASYTFLKDTELSPVEIMLSLGYFALDVFILGMLLRGMVSVWGTSFINGWVIIFLSFLALAAGDVLYTFNTSITAESIANFAWMIQSVFIAFGFYIYRAKIEALAKK